MTADPVAGVGNNWRWVMNPETVKLGIKTNEGVYTSITVNNAKRFPANKSQVEKLGLESINFNMWATFTAGHIPLVDWIIQDNAGIVWRIMMVDVYALGQRFECGCIRLGDKPII